MHCHCCYIVLIIKDIIVFHENEKDEKSDREHFFCRIMTIVIPAGGRMQVKTELSY